MAKKYKIINNFILLILCFFISINKHNCAIFLPFKILDSSENIINFNCSDLLQHWKEPKIYGELMIGSQSQKICTLYDTNIYEIDLFENMCDFEDSYYNKEESSSYNFIKNIGYTHNKNLNCSIINETLYLYTDTNQKNKITFEGMNLFYSSNKKEEFKPNYDDKQYEYHPNTCLNIGFRAQQSIYFGYELNLVRQLKHHQKNNNIYVKSYDWTFKFNSDKEGYLIIGEKPHEFDKKNYREEQYLQKGSKNSKFTHEWFLEVSTIYYTGIRENNTLYNSSFYDDLSIKIDLNYGLIEGTTGYEEHIKEDFFNKLFGINQCFIEVIDEYKIIYCDKTAINYIQKYFPTLKFCFKEQYGMCFDFTYKDLFKEKNGKLFFLIIFNKSSMDRYTLGQIFLKKYLLTFNYDNKLIGFYNKNIPINSTDNKKKEENYSEHSYVSIIIIIILLIIFLVLGFLLGKKIYENRRKRKANELIDDDYEYKTDDIN